MMCAAPNKGWQFATGHSPGWIGTGKGNNPIQENNDCALAEKIGHRQRGDAFQFNGSNQTDVSSSDLQPVIVTELYAKRKNIQRRKINPKPGAHNTPLANCGLALIVHPRWQLTAMTAASRRWRLTRSRCFIHCASRIIHDTVDGRSCFNGSNVINTF